MARRLAPALSATALAVAIIGCSGSVSIGKKTVSKREVERQAQAQFEAKAQALGHAKFPPITCAGDLEAKVGANERCSATFSDGKLGMTVTVTSLSGDTANMHYQADSRLTK